MWDPTWHPPASTFRHAPTVLLLLHVSCCAYTTKTAFCDPPVADPYVLSNYARLAAVCDPEAATQLEGKYGGSAGSPTAAELDILESANIGERGLPGMR